LQTFDASSIIYAWDNYPPEQFPPLWQWIAEKITSDAFSIPSVAFEEVRRRLPACAQWLDAEDVERIEMSNDVVQEASRIKKLLGIGDEGYGTKGVGENDLLIIATAKIYELQLISNEGRQTQLPKMLANCKIPAVCGMASVDVPCVDFITLIKESSQVFGAAEA
jgi:hypothetical protein